MTLFGMGTRPADLRKWSDREKATALAAWDDRMRGEWPSVGAASAFEIRDIMLEVAEIILNAFRGKDDAPIRLRPERPGKDLEASADDLLSALDGGGRGGLQPRPAHIPIDDPDVGKVWLP